MLSRGEENRGDKRGGERRGGVKLSGAAGRRAHETDKRGSEGERKSRGQVQQFFSI